MNDRIDKSVNNDRSDTAYIHCTVNGRKREFAVEPGEMLLEVLRREGYTEVKKGCDTGSCGVCTVLMEGKPVLSCSYLAMRADGKSISTIRGLEAEASKFADFLTATGADQCGFCTPGFTLSVIAMKKELNNPDEVEIKKYLSGNLCRCSGYEGHLRGIKRYLEASHDEQV